MTENQPRDHGGNLDAAIAQFGGTRNGWTDLSTGINPVPYPVPNLPDHCWTALPDKTAQDRLITAAHALWRVPDGADVLAVPGASAAIAHIPHLAPSGCVMIPQPTYNEHAASFSAAGWQISDTNATASVLVHPNNPDGRLWHPDDLCGSLRVIDESFCDIAPEASLIHTATDPNTLILKSFGKFWGLAGLRLGFVIGAPDALKRLSGMLGPWPVSGPALHIGAIALQDADWANETRIRLTQDAARLDTLMTAQSAQLVGGTSLFRLYHVDNAADWQTRLARHHVWSRVFPYNPNWLRLGLPAPRHWAQVEAALA